MVEPQGIPPVLEAQDLVAGYGKDVDIVRGANFRVGEREIVCIVGPNGAGKSTLVKAMFGLVNVRSGHVRLRGEDVTRLPPHVLVRRGVGYVPQTDDVFSALTVEENLRMGGITDKAQQATRVARAYEWFPPLSDKRKQRAGALSGGQRRLVGIARALMTDPEVLLLDEPSAGLSPANVEEVFQRIDDIRNLGVSIAMVEQNAIEGLELADVGYVLDQGQDRIRGTGRDLIDDPRVRELYLGMAPAAPGTTPPTEERR